MASGSEPSCIFLGPGTSISPFHPPCSSVGLKISEGNDIWPVSECLLEVDVELEDILVIWDGRLGLEVESSKQASLKVGPASSLVLTWNENDVLRGNANDLEEARAVGP